MGKSTNRQLDVLAEGLANGLIMRRAADNAGYAATTRSFYKFPHDPAFMARVEHFRRRREWGGMADLAEIVGRLLRQADVLAADSRISAQNLARLYMVSAANLLPKLARAAPDSDGISREALDEWAQTYGAD
jgi:hypothetical protein